jgi:hypothetical protein
MHPVQQLMTKREVALAFQVSERTVDRWRSQRLIRSFKFGRIVRFNPEGITAVVAKLSRSTERRAA